MSNTKKKEQKKYFGPSTEFIQSVLIKESERGKERKRGMGKKEKREKFPHTVFVVSCLLSRTSSKRSLALRVLYSWYSSAKGMRSSFCGVLLKHTNKHTYTHMKLTTTNKTERSQP